MQPVQPRVSTLQSSVLWLQKAVLAGAAEQATLQESGLGQLVITGNSKCLISKLESNPNPKFIK